MTPGPSNPPGLSLGAGVAVVAIDVGGTDTKRAAVGADGTFVPLETLPTPRLGAAEWVVEQAPAWRAEAEALVGRVDALGVVVPGIVDEPAGVAVASHNLGWRDFPLRELLRSRLELPVALGHDVRAAGVAETRLGAAAGERDVAVVVIGTGVAAALVVDGAPLRAGGYAGEIGHLVVADGPACVCGGRGCLEAVASAAAIALRYETRTGRAAAGSRDVLEAMRAGDADAAAVWQDAVEGIATTLRHLSTITGPEVVVLGGGLASAGNELLEPIERALDRRITIQRRPSLRIAALGPRAGLVGAALLARDLDADHGPGAGA
ncbi:ROK family protein [Pseudoclavibacter chungangensis]|uniref:ROK family protein n=1 Tax=Pseudoclavibacter chungangensis TaxID=587635 RepID=A0A7J5BPD3_9MICO|nr:ROK family protein [Pseudoclavibacter chungangensis]KAB1654799.1 ROK family protein [Pseudoclavibacter chungangensis]NYJ68085.1 glucokinase [Pseudoclavibacter chungangensis]